MADRKAIASYLAIAAILAVSVFAMAFSFQITPHSDTATQTTTAIFSGLPPENCLYEIPTNASTTLVTPSTNNSVPELIAGFPNGTTIAFPENSCPQPVYPQLYSLASEAVQSPSFIAAENGSTFLVEGPRISMFSNSSQDISSVTTSFAHWGNQTYPCGTGYTLDLLGLLQVSIPFNQTSGSYDVSNMTVYSVPKSSAVFSCIYLPTGVTTVSTTPTTQSSVTIDSA